MTTDLYPWATLLLSLAIVLLFAMHAIGAGCRYREHHDDRAAWDLLVAVTLAVAAMGLLVSASATFLDIGVVGRSEVRNLGLGLVRGSLLVTASALLLAHRRGVRL